MGTNRRVYTTKATHDYEQHIAESVPEHAKNFEGPVTLWVDYGSEGQWITICEHPHGPRKHVGASDIDNLVKATMDGLQKGDVFNDRQVVVVVATKGNFLDGSYSALVEDKHGVKRRPRGHIPKRYQDEDGWIK